MHIFISYSRGTPYFAESLKDFFENRNYDVWLDLESIQPGKKWQDKIFSAVQNSFVVVVVVTRQAIGSQWILEEIQEAKKQERDIIPVLMERMEDYDLALSDLKIADYQAINYVTQRKQQTDSLLLSTIGTIFSEWSKFSPYIRDFQSNNTDNIRQSIKRLGDARLDRTMATKQLLPLLKHPDDNVAIESLLALWKMADDQAVEPLIELIKSKRFIEGNDYEWLPVDAHSIAYETLGLIGGDKVNSFLKGEIKQHKYDLDSLYDEFLALGLTRDTNNVEFIIGIMEENLNLSETNWREHYFDMSSYFSPIYAFGLLEDSKCVPVMANFIDRCISLVYAGFDDTEMYEAGKITDQDNEIPYLLAYSLFEELGLDTSYVENDEFHVLTLAIQIVGSYSDDRATSALQKVINIQNLETYIKLEDTHNYLEEFVYFAEQAL